MQSGRVGKSSEKHKERSFGENAFHGGIAGGVARIGASPFDVVKIRMQVQESGFRKYRNSLQTVATVCREEGVLVREKRSNKDLLKKLKKYIYDGKRNLSHHL